MRADPHGMLGDVPPNTPLRSVGIFRWYNLSERSRLEPAVGPVGPRRRVGGLIVRRAVLARACRRRAPHAVRQRVPGGVVYAGVGWWDA